MKLGTTTNRNQTMSRKQEPQTLLTILQDDAPLKFFLWKSCLLCNFNIGKNIFMKLGTTIKHHQMMCRKQNHNSTYIFAKLWLFWSYQYEKRARSITWKLTKILMHILVQILSLIRPCTEKNGRFSTFIFLRNHASSKFFIWKSRPLYKFKTVSEIVMKGGTNLINKLSRICEQRR